MRESDIRQLAITYARRADERALDGFAELFTEDGWLTISEGGEERAAFRGRDELRRVLAPMAQYERTLHVVTNHEIDGDAGSVYCIANHLRGRGDEHENIRMLIEYADRYAEVDGAARFASRAVDILWVERVPALVGRLRV
ncbi:nuclear transport factor 2 family protein [Solirubrobacter soli]|uniref:nuclear transport factor 2 family protein n=1 Tax=Solirubrobacter soli TaxID=363832 RepID=UPI000419EA23|nr:nuclear transport factor 2 family protein [Solirubrobacter soli]